jgi:hypothetical protein
MFDIPELFFIYFKNDAVWLAFLHEFNIIISLLFKIIFTMLTGVEAGISMILIYFMSLRTLREISGQPSQIGCFSWEIWKLVNSIWLFKNVFPFYYLSFSLLCSPIHVIVKLDCKNHETSLFKIYWSWVWLIELNFLKYNGIGNNYLTILMI